MVKDITKVDSSPTDWNQHPGSGKSPTNIIPSSQNNLNPTKSKIQQNKQIPTFESEEDWLKRLRRQRQRRGLF